MTEKCRMTTAQALVRYLMAQKTLIDGRELPLFAGVFAIFGHGNVTGLGEALYQVQDELPTLRAHNEQAMAHAAIGFAKAKNRLQMMACTSSIGPGASNMVTAAALAHVNRLPVLFLPGDSFANRRPDPVLQQIEHSGDPNITVNDCFKPVSRYWDRICRPEQLMSALPAAMRVLTDPAECGPVTLALPQDVQAEAHEYPQEFFAATVHKPRRVGPDEDELSAAIALLSSAKQPLVIAGGGVHYSLAWEALSAFAAHHGIPVAETQAGKGALPWNHVYSVGAVGVTGTSAANALARVADVVLAVGTRLTDFTTGSRSLFGSLFGNRDTRLIGLNVTGFDACKHGAIPLVCDARRGLHALTRGLGDYRPPAPWQEEVRSQVVRWNTIVDEATRVTDTKLASDAQVVGVVNRVAGPADVVVGAAGGLPGELHKLWRVSHRGGYHLEYGYSCMGYEIAGGLGVKLAQPESNVFVLVGDGSYLMMNSEIATSVMLGRKLIIVVLDNGGFGCIERLQRACGGASFNNLLGPPRSGPGAGRVDFAAHAAALGAWSEKVDSLHELELAVERALASERTYVIVIETDPLPREYEGGAWWDVPVAEVSVRQEVREARQAYETSRKR